MTSLATDTNTYHIAEHHRFEASGGRFIYLVPSGAVFQLTGLAGEIFSALEQSPEDYDSLVQAMTRRGYSLREITETLDEMVDLDVLSLGTPKKSFPTVPEKAFPIQRIVLNTTNQCNLACGYCYEYSGDKISSTEGKPKFMSSPIAQAAIDTLMKESVGRTALHVTFFGGETLLNYPLMKESVEYARAQASAAGKTVDFSLTTNATLLTEEIADFLAENRIGVTVSIDGDKELHDRMRVFHSGKGSYDVIAPRIKMLLARHRTNSIGARVTLSNGVREVRRIYDHLTQEFGFEGVGFAPVTANPDRLYHINGFGMDKVVDDFEELAWEYRDYAIRGGRHYFTNVSDTIKEIHLGISKAYTCGAGLGLLGVGTSGEIAACHRFVDAPVAQMGNVTTTGLDRDARHKFLQTHHIGARTDCHTCWVRPVCAGGCYHESYIHHRSTEASNLSQCDRIRNWIDLCLRIYSEIGLKNPRFLDRFRD
jgi:uncharacterized protein